MQKLPPLRPEHILILSFAITIMVGTLLLSLPLSTNGGLNFIDALFTSTSATCVTGLVVHPTGEKFTLFGQFVILALIQLGALGITTFSLLFAVMLGRRITLRDRLLVQLSFGAPTLAEVLLLLKYILGFTLLIEGIGAVFLYLCFKEAFSPVSAFYNAVFHAISAFCNAGFSPFTDSLCAFRKDPLLNLVVTTLIILGGIGFFVIFDVLSEKKQLRRLSLHTKVTLLTTAILLICGAVIFFFLERKNTLAGMDFLSKCFASYFQSVTARTAGFNTVNIGDLNEATLLLLCTLMFIGGSPGSCAGGIKTTTFSVLFAFFYSIIKKREDVILGRKSIPLDLVRKALFIFLASFLICFLSSFILLITEKKAFMDVLFEVLSAYGTVGLSTGLTSHLTPIGRLIIIVTMFVGRIGPLVLAFALTQKGAPPTYKYPEERVIIG